jgi:hypothetical protein
MNKEIFTFGPNAELTAYFKNEGVRFLIIGGYAVFFHGCRDTDEIIGRDLDILIDNSQSNTEILISALRKHPFFQSHGIPDAIGLQKLAVQFPLKQHYNLEILTSFEDIDFDQMLERSEPAILGGVEVAVASRTDLIRMKEIAMINQKDQKHFIDIQRLKAV